MLKYDLFSRDIISEAIRTRVDTVVKEHYSALTQEPQISARIGQSLEELNGTRVQNFVVNVITQDIPDRGPNSLEHAIGADLYVGIKVSSKQGEISKGVLVQSKWDVEENIREAEKLKQQCHKLLKYSDKGSFIWRYGPDGASVVPASEIAWGQTSTQRAVSSQTVGEFFRDVLDCRSGDINLVMNGIFGSRKRLGEMLTDLRTSAGVAISVDELD